MQFSPVGPKYILATASDDGVARIWTWDPVSKEFTQIRELKVAGPGLDADQRTIANRPIRSVDFSPDGRSLLTVGAQGTTRVWQLANSTMTYIRNRRSSHLDLWRFFAGWKMDRRGR